MAYSPDGRQLATSSQKAIHLWEPASGRQIFVLAAEGLPSLSTTVKILLAMIGARSAAMAHNRLADRHIDAVNPRTSSRALPAGALSVTYVRLFLACALLLFFAAAASLNRMTLLLSPIAAGLLLLYSYTKRFTWLSHAVLGLCLALAPIGAWIAVTGSIALLPIVLGLAVLLWTAGFDILYALQDEEHDRRVGLQSLPARWGKTAALWVSAALHAGMLALLAAAWKLSGGGWIFAAGILVTAVALVYQHAIVKPRDLSRINAAFFTVNGFISVVLAVFGVADVLAR